MPHPTNEQDNGKTSTSSNHSSIFHRNQSQSHRQQEQTVSLDPSLNSAAQHWRRFFSHPVTTAQEYLQRMRGQAVHPPGRSVSSSSSTSTSSGDGEGGIQSSPPSSSLIPPQQFSATQGQSSVVDSDGGRAMDGGNDAALVVRRLEALEAEVTSLRSQLAKNDVASVPASAEETATTVHPNSSPTSSTWSSWAVWCGRWVTWWGAGTSNDSSLSEVECRVLGVAKGALREFCARHRIDPSHGERHALQVLDHAQRAVTAASVTDKTTWGKDDLLAILLAALLHDVDDHKYFPRPAAPADGPASSVGVAAHSAAYPNARAIMTAAGVSESTMGVAVAMIDLVGCSSNGNAVPPHVADKLHYLIPRWADRLEAVGAIGVVRCYQYTKERGQPLSSASSPRPQTADEVWQLATPARFEAYQASGGSSADMISHYYDKLLHIAKPPASIVQNAYLEQAAAGRATELVEVCVRFGRTGKVDEEYIRSLEDSVSASK